MDGESTVWLEQCLDASCNRTAPVLAPQAAEVEVTLWNHSRRTGVVALASRYRAPNRIEFGRVIFDHVAFGPTRRMQELYLVDRLSFWPVTQHPHALVRPTNQITVRLPRRETTQLLELIVPQGAGAPGQISIAPVYLGMRMGLMGFWEITAHRVVWNQREFLAFPGAKIGRDFELRLPPGPLVVKKTGRKHHRLRWQDPYLPLHLELTNR